MSSPKWTKEQQAVIDSRNSNLLVAAAAGSGKTAVLVERIIQMITDKDNPIDIDKLLVVTFTNAAASEMRERIGDAIGKALDKEPENTHLQKQLVLLNKAGEKVASSTDFIISRKNNSDEWRINESPRVTRSSKKDDIQNVKISDGAIKTIKIFIKKKNLLKT